METVIHQPGHVNWGPGTIDSDSYKADATARVPLPPGLEHMTKLNKLVVHRQIESLEGEWTRVVFFH